MALALLNSGTHSVIDGTETLLVIATAVVHVVTFDLSEIIAGDSVQIRAEGTVESVSSTQFSKVIEHGVSVDPDSWVGAFGDVSNGWQSPPWVAPADGTMSWFFQRVGGSSTFDVRYSVHSI